MISKLNPQFNDLNKHLILSICLFKPVIPSASSCSDSTICFLDVALPNSKEVSGGRTPVFLPSLSCVKYSG